MNNPTFSVMGILYIVATPIGNKDDITNRAIKTLMMVDLILAEDTRHSSPLLRNLGIKKPLIALHEHNETEKSEIIIQWLKEGKNIALISDAGTPLISDPGFFLVRLARQAGLTVTPIPGPCALIAAISAAGVACDSFTFIGFLPAKNTHRLEKLNQLKQSLHTIVVYESTHRIIASIEDIITAYGVDYTFVLAKEITKTFEHIMLSTGAQILDWLTQNKNHTNGEFVLILPALPQAPKPNSDALILNTLLSELSLKQAVKCAAKLSDTPKNELYSLALTLQQK